ncbi:unnamed protein product, partial [Brenthis ino]
MLVRSEVSLRYAHTTIVTNVKNPARRSQQATFHVLLPDTAFITGFVMTLGGKSYKAYVKEKEEAKKIYTDAVSQGIGAAHIAAKARDSNHFTVSVNVEPNSKATFNLTYEELLTRRNGVYNHAINLHPGALVPRMEVSVHIKESQKIKLLRVPEVRTGNEIDATETDAQNALVSIQKSGDEKEATITFTPDLEEQKRLIRIYADKTKQSASHNWYGDVEEDNDKEGTIGQFVVQYDVERPENGEVLVNDGYFVHFFAPQTLTPLSKYVVFVLDTSGSMGGRKIEQLQAAMRAILGELNSNDYFSIVEFDSDVQVHELKEADEPEKPRTYPYYSWRTESKPVVLISPSLATPDNIAKAQIIVSRLAASGGTNIYEALRVALDLIHKVDEKNQTSQSANTTEIQKTETSELEPIIIFLTDGDPTVGETSTQRIISHMTEKNSGPKKAAIFSLAFGEDADRTFLRKLSLRNDGFMRHIYEAADAELQLRHFYRQVSSPLLAGVHFVYPPDQVKGGSVTKTKYSTIYAGSEVVVAGELAPGVSELAPSVLGFCADSDKHGRKRYEVRPTTSPGRAGEYLPLERLWAYLSVKQLLDQRETTEHPEDFEKQALELSLKYAFVTPLTSLVVVKPNATDAVNAESVDENKPPALGLPGLLPNAYPAFGSLLQIPAPAINLGSGSFAATGAHPLSLDFITDIRAEEEEDLDTVLGNAHRGGFIPLSGFSSAFSGHRPALLGYSHSPSRIIGGAVFDSPPQNKFLAGQAFYESVPYILSTVPPRVVTSLAPLVNKYHLEGFSWALSLLNYNTDALEFSSNGKNITLEVSKDSDPPKAVNGDEECANSVNAKQEGTEGSESAGGVCVYLTRCAAAKDITVDVYHTTYCTVNTRYAGVCCPRNQVDLTKA